MKTTAKDIILLCKGWYDKEKYSSILEALKAYYKKNYCSDVDENILTEAFLLEVLLRPAMWELSINYQDRFSYFVSQYLFGKSLSVRLSLPDEKNVDYEYQLFYRITSFLTNLIMRGEAWYEIETDDYFYESYDEYGKPCKKLIENIIQEEFL